MGGNWLYISAMLNIAADEKLFKRRKREKKKKKKKKKKKEKKVGKSGFGKPGSFAWQSGDCTTLRSY